MDYGVFGMDLLRPYMPMCPRACIHSFPHRSMHFYTLHLII